MVSRKHIELIAKLTAAKFDAALTEGVIDQIVTEFENATRIVKKIKKIEVGDKVWGNGHHAYITEFCSGALAGWVRIRTKYTGICLCDIKDLVLVSNYYKYEHQA